MMRIERAAGAASMMACLLAGEPAGAQDVGNVGAGYSLAQRICSECHAIGSGDHASPNPAAPRFETIANVPGMTAAALTVALQTSHRAMPNVILKADELSDIIGYILSLKRAD